MKSLANLIASAIALIALTLCGVPVCEANQPSAAVNPGLLDADLRFSFKLLEAVAAEDFGQNIFISPLSIALALDMTYNGSNGETKAAMATALELEDLSLDDVNEANAALIETLTNPDPKVQLSIANSLWGREDIPFKRDFLKRNEDFYKAKITNLDFSNPQAADIINAWVKEKTNGKIPQIVGPIDSSDILFLINAIYFKGIWTVKFDSAKTKDLDFHLLSGGVNKHPMMAQSGSYLYYEDPDFQAINLPYGGKRMSMYVFLPSEKSSLKRFRRSLTAANWKSWMSRFGQSEGQIVLPRFKLEYEKDLNESLKALGMGVAFDKRKANFQPMVKIPLSPPEVNVYIDEVKHKTFVEVSEEGTEAAAVTSVGVGMITSMPPPPFVMIVDRPFFCAIRDNETGVILFMGYIVDPT